MEQRDIELLQTVPSYHLQVLAKTRGIEHLETSFSENHSDVSLSSRSSSPTLDPADLARSLFDAAALKELMSRLDEMDVMVLRELVTSGGRANSRDLALYLQNAELLTPTKM